MKKRFFAICMAVTMCAVALGGCGEKNGSGDSGEAAFTPQLDTEAEATINIIGSMENFEALEAAINDFNEYYPNYEVLYTCMDNYNSMIEQRLQDDDTVDIFMSNSVIYQKEYVASVCLNLLDTDIDFSAIDDKAVNACTSDGNMYELPLAYITSGLLVNNTLLEQEGISVPTNNSELLAACETLKNDGYTPIQGYIHNSLMNFIKNMIYVRLASSENRDDTVASLSSGEDGCSEIVREEFELIETYLSNGYIDMEVNNTYEDNYNDAILKFFEGDVPFLLCTTETYSGTKKRETKSEHFSSDPFEYSFICAPVGEEDAYYYIENWSGFSINSNSSHIDEATEFIRFLATEEQINQIAEIKGLPSVAVNHTDERFDSIYQGNADYTYVNDYFFPQIIQEGLYSACEAIGSKGADVDGALEAMEDRLKEGE